MKTKLFILMIIIILFGSSCSQLKNFTNKPEFNTKKDIAKAEEIIENSSVIIKETTGDITKEAQSINNEAATIQGKLPEDIKPVVSPHLDNIKKSSNNIIKDTTKINKATAELTGASSLLENAKIKIVNTETALDKITLERDNALIAQKKAEEAEKSLCTSILKV